MGCHTWFARPITDEEFNLMKEYCLKEAAEYLLQDDELYNPKLYKDIERSFKENIPCIDGYYWYQLGWGSGNPKLNIDLAFLGWKENKIYIDCPEFHETARVSLGIYTYPHKIIHSKKELRRYVGKKYFNLTKEDHERLSEFWRKYPGGIMCWG